MGQVSSLWGVIIVFNMALFDLQLASLILKGVGTFFPRHSAIICVIFCPFVTALLYSSISTLELTVFAVVMSFRWRAFYSGDY